MPDLTIPDAAVEAAARAAYEEGFLRHVRRTRLGFTWDDISDEARESWRQVVIAAAPYIAAQALEDFADAHRMPWTMFLREDGSPVTVGDLMRETAARFRIEATNG